MLTRPRKVLDLVLLVVLGLGSAAVAGDPVYEVDALLGVWKTEPNDNGDFSHIEIYLADEKYSGRIVYLNSPVVLEGDEQGGVGQPRVDFENPDQLFGAPKQKVATQPEQPQQQGSPPPRQASQPTQDPFR